MSKVPIANMKKMLSSAPDSKDGCLRKTMCTAPSFLADGTIKNFKYVIASMKKKEVDPTTYITHRVLYAEVKNEFETGLSWRMKLLKQPSQ